MNNRPHRSHATIVARFVLAVVVSLAATVSAADEPVIRPSRVGRNAGFLTSRDGTPIQLAGGVAKAGAMAAIEQFGAAFGINDPQTQLRLIKTETDALGYVHTSYQQVHHGIDAFSGIVRVHQDANGGLIAMNGDFYAISPKLGTTPAITGDEAIAECVRVLALAEADTERSDLVIVDPGWYGDPSIGPHLAYYVIVGNDSIPVREAFFIDAVTGEVLDQWTMLHAALTRQIYNGNGGSGLPGTLARGEGDPVVASPADVNRAYDYYADVYDYYFNAFGRDSIDGNGLNMIATVNSTNPPCPNATWNGAQMIFCDGAVTDDIVGHELTHGVTQYTADLIYQNQSGQLNESYSDVFGELIDLYNGGAEFAGTPTATPFGNHPTGPGVDTPNTMRDADCSLSSEGNPDGVRWLMGEDAAVFGGAIRDMWNPPCNGDPDFANSSLQTCNPLDSGGVHSGSGVPNHAFAMLTDGKTFNGYTINGIGPIKAGAVWYRALTHYLTPASDFGDAYLALMQAANDLVGTNPNDPRTGLPSASTFTAADVLEVEKALLAVEMNTDGACGAADDVLSGVEPVRCADRETIFADDFETGAPGWTVFNSGPPTPYDWTLTIDPLPAGVSGTAWFCEDADVGDCGANDESAIHSLVSPSISTPANAAHPRVSFRHVMASEGAWDGGNLKISVNAGGWQVVPRDAYTFNAPNAPLNSVAQTNTNPMAGEAGWTGAGGSWGTSIADLSSLVAPGDSIQFRFDFGKDGCTGGPGWYVDEFEYYNCIDCDSDTKADIDQFRFARSTNAQGNIGVGSPQVFVIPSPPIAVSDVMMTVRARGDFAASDEFVDVDLNGTLIATLFAMNGSDCPGTPESETAVIPASLFNSAAGGGNATLTLIGSSTVNPALSTGACRGASFIALTIQYDLAPTDCDANLVLDGCQRANLTIAEFVDVLLTPASGTCIHDFNNDGNVDGRDIQEFVVEQIAP
ncbi:MAG: M4 family metallopeptidase [Phycisphaerales bacterium]|nr:M4 family metallopeptidase [Phycisphaerales bacterium]MCB9856217.1 M4 family metallopeptidase [Phycisphaerales bacterium]MCB9863344.1 M4 family metallopeptidase [Phycisphaerales bacterium]